MSLSDRKKTADICATLAGQIDANHEAPLYRQIFSAMERFIQEGRLEPGMRLPPERELMELLGVSRSTLRLALADLAERRYISATQGRGNFILEPPLKRPLRLLALERFQASYWSVAPLHYDWINEAGKAAQVRIHYHYAPTLEEMVAELRHPPEGYDGIVIFRAHPDWSAALTTLPDQVFESCPVPVMVIDRPIRKRGLNVVSWDFREASRLATQQLIRAGHQRIGYISGTPVEGHSFETFYKGYIDAMNEAGLRLYQEDQLLFDGPIFVAGVIPEEVKSETTRFLRERQFTALVPVLVSSAIEHAILKEGIHLPDELSVAMVSEEHALAPSVFRWSGFQEPSAHIVQRGISVLADICRGRQKPGVFELIPPEPCPGATIKPH